MYIIYPLTAVVNKFMKLFLLYFYNWYRLEESNSYSHFRRVLYYPLYEGGMAEGGGLEPQPLEDPTVFETAFSPAEFSFHIKTYSQQVSYVCCTVCYTHFLCEAPPGVGYVDEEYILIKCLATHTT